MHGKYCPRRPILFLCRYLEVVLWVPVAVKNDDGVGGGEIDAQAARPR